MSDSDCVDNSVGDFDQLSVIVENVAVKTAKISIRSCKSVRFADDCGKDLTTVRVMTEPSDYPPTISASVYFVQILFVTSFAHLNLS